MNIIGLITEYNPFHNGHKYQIDKIKEMYPDSIIITVTSSHFTQRGEISLVDKWTKTKISLSMGVDMVIELPFIFSTQSADTFAHASIKLLNELKIDTLVFGSESNDIELFKSLASVQLNNKDFNTHVQTFLDKGDNYPTALSNALKELNNDTVIKPNDLLAVSYTKEILLQNPNINLVSIKRTNDYHDTTSNEEIVSASNIRSKLINNEDVSKLVPSITYEYIKDIKPNNDKLFELLKYKIISENDLEKYLTVDEGIENRLFNNILESNSLEEFISKIKTKRYTYNKLNRMFIHILVGLTKKEKESYNSPSYIRILGMNKKGQEYLSSIKKDINLPILSKWEKDNQNIGLEFKATCIYSLLVNKPELIEQEYKNKVIIVD